MLMDDRQSASFTYQKRTLSSVNKRWFGFGFNTQRTEPISIFCPLGEMIFSRYGDSYALWLNDDTYSAKKVLFLPISSKIKNVIFLESVSGR